MKFFKNEPVVKIKPQKFVQRSDNMIFRRVSKLYEKSELNQLKAIQLGMKSRKSVRLPRIAKTIVPTKNIKSIKKQQKINTLTSFILSVLIICGSIYENLLVNENNSELTANTNLIRIILAGLASIQILLIFIYYFNYLSMKISYKIISKHSLLHHDSETFFKLITELIICLMVIPPYIVYEIKVKQLAIEETLTIDDIILGLIFLRVFHLLKIYYEYSYFNSLKAQFYCEIEAVTDMFRFTIKCFLKDKPWFSVLLMFGLSTTFCGIILHVFERSIPESPFAYIWNGFWIVSYTQPTIGYGDIAPKTHLGRLVIVICSFFGLFMYSYVVLVVRNIADLSDNELKLYSEIKYRGTKAKKLKSKSILLIQRWWRLVMKRRVKTNTIADVFRYQNQLKGFSQLRLIELQEKNQTLSEEVNKISKSLTDKFAGTIKYLENAEQYSELANKLANMNYGVKHKLKKIYYDLEKYGPQNKQLGNDLLTVSSRRKVSAASSRAAVKKLRGRAVKKLITDKLKKNSISISNDGSASSNEDFYSSRG